MSKYFGIKEGVFDPLASAYNCKGITSAEDLIDQP
jgi:hypothetical protein